MKTSISKILLALPPLALFSGCNFLQVDQSAVGFTNPDRLSVVEKAWMARHEYDAKTGLLHPYYRGMRYGAIRSYNRGEKTLSSKEWWMKDRKLNDLADQPLRVATRQPIFPVTPPATAEPSQPTLATNPAIQPTGVGGDATALTEIPGAGVDMPVFSTGEAIPALPGGIPGGGLGIDSPFLPPAPALPGDPATPTTTLPGMPLPGMPLPGEGGAFPGAPPAGGGAFPGVPPAGGGAFPGAPPVVPAPVDGNPFGAPPPPGANPNPADPAPAPADPGENPFPAPPPAPAGENPFPAPAPAPPDENPFPAPPPAPGGDEPGKPPPLPF